MRATRVPIEDSAWRDFTLTHPDATPFHLPVWAATIAACYRFNASALVLQDADVELLGGIPIIEVQLPFQKRRWVSLPFTDSCPVLLRPSVPADEATAALAQYALECGVAELEVRTPLPVSERVHTVCVGYQHTLALPADPADLHPHRNYRQHRNQATKRGVRVVRGTAKEDIDTFYRLQTLTRRRLGVPVQPRRWFELVRDRVLAAGHGFVATAMLDGKPVAACLYLTHNGTIVAKYSASDPSRPELGASHLIHWDVMTTACAEGYRTYDLGRTDLDADGLRTYKTRMGAEEQPLIYSHVRATRPPESRPNESGLPAHIIRNSPPWVCRLAGKALYRWTA